TEDEIKKAYKKQALKWHPDRNPNHKAQAEENLKELAEAHEVLSDKQKREIFDQYGGEGLKGGIPRGGPGGFQGFRGPGGTTFHFTPSQAEDIFASFFGGRSPFGRGASFFGDDDEGIFGMGGMGGM